MKDRSEKLEMYAENFRNAIKGIKKNQDHSFGFCIPGGPMMHFSCKYSENKLTGMFQMDSSIEYITVKNHGKRKLSQVLTAFYRNFMISNFQNLLN